LFENKVIPEAVCRAMGMESKKIPEGLDGNGRPGNRFWIP